MKQRPILFNSEMVRALLDGRKTQARRIVKPAKDRNGSGCQLAPCEIAGEVNGGDYSLCPYGRPGDQLWVREAFEVGLCTETTLAYRATHKPSDLDEGWNEPIKWKPSIHMPRWASRITLEIVRVRVERLHETTLGDICKEGLARSIYEFIPATDGFRVWRELWEGINGADSWAANPWVWVIEFERVEQ